MANILTLFAKFAVTFWMCNFKGMTSNRNTFSLILVTRISLPVPFAPEKCSWNIFERAQEKWILPQCRPNFERLFAVKHLKFWDHLCLFHFFFVARNIYVTFLFPFLSLHESFDLLQEIKEIPLQIVRNLATSYKCGKLFHCIHFSSSSEHFTSFGACTNAVKFWKQFFLCNSLHTAICHEENSRLCAKCCCDVPIPRGGAK